MKKLFLFLCFMLFITVLFAEEALFSITTTEGDTIFAVYPSGIKVLGEDGEAVMIANRDSIRMYIDETQTPDRSSRGGFAVGGVASRTFLGNYLTVEPDSTRIYFNEDEQGRSSRGGFAVGGVASRSIIRDYLSINPDSTRINVKDSDNGFSIGNIQGDGINKFLDVTSDNSFVGYRSGINSTGVYNTFLGFESGMNNSTGHDNIFIGFKSGYNNSSGWKNIFIGNESGYNNTTAWYNLAIGDQAGYANQTATNQFFIGQSSGKSLTDGYGNTFVGHASGENSTNCSSNSFIGYYAGSDNLTGGNNVYVGYASGSDALGSNNTFLGAYTAQQKGDGDNNVMIGSGSGLYNTSGSGNIFIGANAGQSETNSNKLLIENSNADSTEALIWGDFNTNVLTFNANVGIGTTEPSQLLHISGGKLQIGSYETFEDGGSFAIAINSDFRATADGQRDLGSSQYRWHNIYATNGVIQTSDIRDKENIAEMKYGIDEVMKLRPVSFTWKEKPEDGNKLGLIAQDLVKILPEVVKTHDNKIIDEESDKTSEVELNRYGVYYSELIPVLIKAIQEQQETIDSQQIQNDILEERIKKIEELIN